MSDSKRLHPIVSILTAGKRVRNILPFFITILIAGGRESKLSLLISLGISLVIFILTLLTGILSWLRFTYRFEENELRIEYGVFVRKKRYIPLERIQSINYTEGLIQQMFGLVKVRIETAGGENEDEAVFSAITKEEAQLIQEYVSTAKQESRIIKTVEEDQKVFSMSTSELLILSLTSGGVGVVISAVFALFSQLDDWIPYKKIFGGLEEWALKNIMAIMVVVFIGFFLAWVISLFITMLKYANFTVVRTEGDFIISYGLIEKKQMTIPLRRIQAIRIKENILRQMIGYATVYIVSAGSGSAENQEETKVILLPIIRIKDIAPLLQESLPDYQLEPILISPPKRALHRYIFRTWYVIVPIVLASILFLKAWGALSLVLFAVGTIWAILKYKDAGWCLEGKQLSLRYRTIIRTTVLMQKNRIQSLKMRENYFQQKRELGTIEAFVKSGSGDSWAAVVDLEKGDIQKIYQWYSRKRPKETAG